jgi:adenylate cyclase
MRSKIKECYGLCNLLNIMKKIFSTIAIILFALPGYTQNQHLIDSLEKRLNDNIQDTARANVLYAIARAYRFNNPDTAQNLAEQTLALSQKIDYKPGLQRAYNLLGTIIKNKGKYHEAIELYLKALAICQEIKDQQGIASCLNNIGSVYNSLGNYPEALKNYSASLPIYEEIGDKQGIAKIYLGKGNVYSNLADYPEALNNYSSALKINEELGDKYYLSACYSNVGIVYEKLGNYPEALKNHLASLKIYEQTGNKPGIGRAYNNIGIIYVNQENYNQALENYSAALKIYEETGDKPGIASCYNNLGIVYRILGKYPEALVNYSNALKIYTEIGDKSSIARCYNNIGNVYNDQHNYSEALNNLFIASHIFNEIADKNGMAGNCINIGRSYIGLHNFNEASMYLNKGLALSKEAGSLQYIKDSYDHLATLDSAQGNFKHALEHYKLFVITRDSLLNIENTKKITQQQMQYDFERKEAIIKLEQDKKDAIAYEELKKQKLVRNSFIGGFAVVLLFAVVIFRQRIKISREKRIGEAEKERSEELLLNILPSEIAIELKQTGQCKPKTFSMVTVMFADFKDFTAISERVSAELLVNEINYCFSAFDNVIQKYKIEKIKTVGDAYMCAGGLPALSYTHAFDVVMAALDIKEFMLNRRMEKEGKGEIAFEIRIGIHTGPVVAGIVGTKKFSYDIWGDTVNIAARMEQNCLPGNINISSATHDLLKEKFVFTYRGKIHAKNKGEIDMYIVDAIK